MKRATRLTLRARLTLAFAGAVLATLLCFGVAVTLVLWLGESDERESAASAQIDASDDVRQSVLAMLAVSPVVLAAAVGMGHWLSRRATAPMREASRRAREARQTGAALELPREGNGDAWDELAETLNSLNADARASYEKIQRFTADAAHELRNPLTTILGEADLALRNPGLSPDSAGAWTAVRADAERLRRLLDSLLSLARADSGRLVTDCGEVELDALAARTLEAVGQRAGRPELALEQRGTAGAVIGDGMLLGRVLENVVGNAVRYARSTVTVSFAREGDRLRVRVEDDGPGVPAEERERIFERFVRLDPSGDEQGFGLGLPIARAIAVAHRGSLRCLARDRGACFELELPVGSESAPEAIPKTA